MNELKELKELNMGRFSIPKNDIDSNLEMVAAVFSDLKMVVVRAEMMFCSDKIEYYGFSEKFEKIKKGSLVPEYDLHVKNVNGKYDSVFVVRV